jgi:hypothetical protein
MKFLLPAIAFVFLFAACGDDASKKGTATGTTTPPPAEKKVEPKK